MKMAVMAAVLGLSQIGAAWADHLDQRTAEVRTVLYYHATPEVMAAALPAGWEAMDVPAGPAKGANLTVNISDQLLAVTPQGTAAGDARGQAVTISARVRNPKTGENCAMVLFGMTNGVDVPGPYGRHHAASVTMVKSEHSDASAGVDIEEVWDAATKEGDRLHVALDFPRGATVLTHVDQETHSGERPNFYRIYRMDMVQDTVLSRALGVDRTRKLEVTSAGAAARLLDGAELKAVVSVPSYRRDIWLPE